MKTTSKSELRMALCGRYCIEMDAIARGAIHSEVNWRLYREVHDPLLDVMIGMRRAAEDELYEIFHDE